MNGGALVDKAMKGIPIKRPNQNWPPNQELLEKIYDQINHQNALLTDLRTHLFPEVFNLVSPASGTAIDGVHGGVLNSLLPTQTAATSNIVLLIDDNIYNQITLQLPISTPLTNLGIRFHRSIKIVSVDNVVWMNGTTFR